MKIICFRGAQNTGKSTLIKKILKEKLEVKLMFIENKFWIEKNWEGKDVGLTCLYDNKKIGVFSHGDVPKTIKKWLKDAEKESCQIVIFSCHKKQNKTFLDYIKNKFKGNLKYFECEWDKNWTNKRKDEENKKRFNNFNEYFDKLISEQTTFL